jgi:hypothetical protein
MSDDPQPAFLNPGLVKGMPVWIDVQGEVIEGTLLLKGFGGDGSFVEILNVAGEVQRIYLQDPDFGPANVRPRPAPGESAPGESDLI